MKYTKMFVKAPEGGVWAVIFDRYGDPVETHKLEDDWHAYHWAIHRIAQLKQTETVCFGKNRILEDALRDLR